MKLLHNIRSSHTNFLVLYLLISLSFSSQAFAQVVKKAVDTKSPEYVNVTEKTKNRIAEIQKKSPQFLIEDEVLACIKGELIDSECEATAVAVADAGESMIKIEADNRELALRKDGLLKKDKALDEKDKALDEKDKALDEKMQALTEEKQALTEEMQALAKIKIIGDHCTIVTGLVQLALYVDYDLTFSSEANAMSQVTTNKTTPKEVLALFDAFLTRKKNGRSFTWKNDVEKIMDMASKYLEIANQLETSIKDPEFKKDAVELIKLTTIFYESNRKRLIIKH